MITKDNLQSLLENLEFEKKSPTLYCRSYGGDTRIEVDFAKKKISYLPVDSRFGNGEYPTKERPANGFVIHRDTTLNFNQKESFVCLVCTHLLLKKRYEARYIVFEPSFTVGHVNKPSYGDILVFDKEYNPFVLIENKTYGAEFSKEWGLMQRTGGQLFSYLGPLTNAMPLPQGIVLFSADFDDGSLIPKSHIITLRDNEKRIAELGNDAKTFATCTQYFDVWNESYAKSF